MSYTDIKFFTYSCVFRSFLYGPLGHALKTPPQLTYKMFCQVVKPILISKSKYCIIMCIIDNFQNEIYNCLKCKVFRCIQDNPSQNILRLAFILFKTCKFMALFNDIAPLPPTSNVGGNKFAVK